MVLPELSSTEAVELIFSEKIDKKKEKKRVSSVQYNYIEIWKEPQDRLVI